LGGLLLRGVGYGAWLGKLLLVDNDPLFCCGLRVVLQLHGQSHAVIEATTPDQAIALATSIDLAIVAVLPDGVALTSRLRASVPGCKVLGLSGSDEPIRISDMMRAGASGYAFKHQPENEIAEAIETVLRGGRYVPRSISEQSIDSYEARRTPFDDLTKREREVLAHLIAGTSNGAIATTLYLSPRTVETHRQNLLAKLGVHTIVELVHIAARAGLLRWT